MICLEEMIKYLLHLPYYYLTGCLAHFIVSTGYLPAPGGSSDLSRRDDQVFVTLTILLSHRLSGPFYCFYRIYASSRSQQRSV